MNKKILVFSFIAIGVFISGCGGGGGVPSIDENSSSSYISFSGYVIDPEIKGAEVSVKCGSSRTYSAASNTNEDGAFTINGIPSSEDLSTCIFSTYGGNDFGDDLSGIELKSSYSLFDTNNEIYITPLTTLLLNHNDFENNSEKAKEEIAAFFSIDKEDIAKNPLSKLSLSKVSKKIIITALSNNSSNEKLGLIDINTVLNSSDNFGEYVSNTLSSLMQSDDFNSLQVNLQEIDNINTINDIRKSTLERYARDSIYTNFKLNGSEFYTNNKDTIDTNIEYLAKKIAEANSEIKEGESQTTYYRISSFHMKKAYHDLQLQAEFENDVLKEDLQEKLKLSLSDFATYVDEHPIDIINIDNFIIYSAQTSKVILRDKNNLRREYYTLSDISNIAKALSLAENNYNDDVNDPINAQVAIGLGKMGFTDEALDFIEDNIYSPSEKKDAYENFGKLLLTLDDKENAAIAFTKQYKLLINELENDKALTASQRNELKGNIFRYLTQTGYYEDDIDTNIIGVYSIADKIIDYAPLEAANKYHNYTNALDDMALDLISYNNDISAAKTFYKEKLMPLVNEYPVSPGAYFQLFFPLLHSKVFGLDNSSILQKINSGNYGSVVSANELYFTINKGLSGNVIEAISELDNFSKTTYKYNAINYGMGAVLFLNDKEDLLFNTYYTDSSIYSSSKKDDLMKFATQLRATTFMPTSMMIKVMGDNTKLKDYLDRLKKLADSWYIVSQNDEDKINNISDSNALKIYAQWSDSTYSSRFGYLAMASMYKQMQDDSSAVAIIEDAITKVSAFTDMSIKINALFNIWDAILELEYDEDIDTSEFFTQLENAALSDGVTDTHKIIKVANILNLYGEKIKAQSLIDHAYDSLSNLLNEDLEDVKEKTISLIGSYNTSNKYFATSIASAYFQLGKSNTFDGIAKAKTIIKEARTSIESLEATTDQDVLFINLAAAYGGINDIDSLSTLISQKLNSTEIDRTIVQGAKALATYDAFSSTDVASIDFDGDGKPDFFNYTASSEDIAKSTLELDDDIDGDGLLDTVDTFPYYKNTNN